MGYSRLRGAFAWPFFSWAASCCRRVLLEWPAKPWRWLGSDRDVCGRLGSDPNRPRLRDCNDGAGRTCLRSTRWLPAASTPAGSAPAVLFATRTFSVPRHSLRPRAARRRSSSTSATWRKLISAACRPSAFPSRIRQEWCASASPCTKVPPGYGEPMTRDVEAWAKGQAGCELRASFPPAARSGRTKATGQTERQDGREGRPLNGGTTLGSLGYALRAGQEGHGGRSTVARIETRRPSACSGRTPPRG